MRNVERSGQMFFWSDIPTIQKDEGRNDLYDIPSDDRSRFNLSLHMMSAVYGDIFISMNDTTPDKKYTHLRAIRLRSLFGGGFNPFITESFVSILNYFNNGMQEFPTTEKQTRERINSNSTFVVKRGKDDEPRLSIIGIQDDDRDPGFIDIFVLNNGDVKLRVREQRQIEFQGETKESLGEMLFKTKENGGKNPFIATALTRLAEKIANAKPN